MVFQMQMFWLICLILSYLPAVMADDGGIPTTTIIIIVVVVCVVVIAAIIVFCLKFSQNQSDTRQIAYVSQHQHQSFLPTENRIANLRKYLQRGNFPNGINWRHIVDDHCDACEDGKSQFFKKDMVSAYLKQAARNPDRIFEDDNAIILESSFNEPIGYDKSKDGMRNIDLYCIRVVFSSDNFFIVTAYPIRKK